MIWLAVQEPGLWKTATSSSWCSWRGTTTIRPKVTRQTHNTNIYFLFLNHQSKHCYIIPNNTPDRSTECGFCRQQKWWHPGLVFGSGRRRNGGFVGPVPLGFGASERQGHAAHHSRPICKYPRSLLFPLLIGMSSKKTFTLQQASSCTLLWSPMLEFRLLPHMQLFTLNDKLRVKFSPMSLP